MQDFQRGTQASAAVFTGDPLALIGSYPPFAPLPPWARTAIAGRLQREDFSPGQLVIRQGDAGDRLFLIAAGRAEVVARDADGQEALLAVLGPGEGFGEMALVTGAPRSADVRAVTIVHLFSLAAADFRRLQTDYPELREAARDLVVALERATFLKRATPFAVLGSAELRELASRLRPRSIAAGEVLMRQGEIGDFCAIIRSGELRVVVRAADGVEEQKAVLGPGASVGEMALLTGEPRSATVIAAHPTEVWVIDRATFEIVVAASETLGAAFRAVLGRRARPARRPGVAVGQRRTDSGEPVYILRDPERQRYFQLSAEGLAVWELLDGSRTLADVATAIDRRFGGPSSLRVAQLVKRLADQGFVEVPQPRALYRPQRSWPARLLRAMRRLATARSPLPTGSPDAAFCLVADVDVDEGHVLHPATMRLQLTFREHQAPAYEVDLPLVAEPDLQLGDRVELWYYPNRHQPIPRRLVHRRSGRVFVPEQMKMLLQ